MFRTAIPLNIYNIGGGPYCIFFFKIGGPKVSAVKLFVILLFGAFLMIFSFLETNFQQ